MLLTNSTSSLYEYFKKAYFRVFRPLSKNVTWSKWL
jgi:hypothetical protein